MVLTRSSEARAKDERPPAARASAGDVLCPEAKQSDGRLRLHERIRDNVSVAERQRRHRLAIDKRKQHVSLRRRRIVQRGKIAYDLLVIDACDP
jgi:hypothetical protein